MLAGDFPYVPMKSLVEILSNNKNHLYPAYIATLEIAANNMFHGAPLPWTQKKYPSPLNKRYEDKTLFVTLRSTQDATEGYLIPELALSRLVKGQQSLRLSMISIRRRDALSLQQAMASAQVSECEGCFAECPLNHLIHCDGEQPHVSHRPFRLRHLRLTSCIQLFCSNCCATNAETQIAQSKHELQCMSIEDCSAGFSVGERAKFLSVDHIKALDRIEKEAAVEKDAQGVQQQNY
jgi:TRIAD3 protein (E3 ubiquitin-protein ligase RNF216)